MSAQRSALINVLIIIKWWYYAPGHTTSHSLSLAIFLIMWQFFGSFCHMNQNQYNIDIQVIRFGLSSKLHVTIKQQRFYVKCKWLNIAFPWPVLSVEYFVCIPTHLAGLVWARFLDHLTEKKKEKFHHKKVHLSWNRNQRPSVSGRMNTRHCVAPRDQVQN